MESVVEYRFLSIHTEPHPLPHSAGPLFLQVWLAQRACSQSLLWRLEAEAVLEIQEVFEDEDEGLGKREARFSLVQGDFKVCALREVHGMHAREWILGRGL